MTRSIALSALAVLCPVALSACATSQPEPEAVYIPPPQIKTCFERGELTAVTVPAETRTLTAITMVDNPPYAPIEREETIVQEIAPAYTEYRDAAGNTVGDEMICDSDLVSRPVGAGEMGAGNMTTPAQPTLAERGCIYSEQYDAMICPEGTVVN